MALPTVRHKILVLEFESPEQSTWGKEISQVLAQEILGTISGVTSVGVANLRQPAKKIELTTDTVVAIAERNKALVVIWGEFYRQGETVSLYAHLRFVPQEGFQESSLGIDAGLSAGNRRMVALPPTRQVNFEPIELSLESLEGLRTLFEHATVLHQESSPTSKIVGSLKPGDTYYPIESKGDWIRIRMTGKKTGWIQYKTLGSKKEFSALRAVVIYAHGVLQYISGNPGAAARSMETYLDQYGAGQDPMNQAMAHILLGTARWRAGTGSMGIQEAIAEYQKAVDLLPNSSSPATYLSIAQALSVKDATREAPPARRQEARALMSIAERRLIHVIQTENDIQSVRNLWAFYQMAEQVGFLSEPGEDPLEYAQRLKGQQQKLLEIEAKLR
jgi:hypothetical protein